MVRENFSSEDRESERFFSPDTMMWQVDREMALVAAGGRALLMQLAHPKVAAGVADHSHFKEDPLGRLYRTMDTMWSIGFDDLPQARAALDRVKSVHKKVQGAIRPAEPLPAGTPYYAQDPELLLWVHATLIDTGIVGYDLLVKPLTPDEKARYYDDSKKLAHLFEIPDALVPSSLAEFSGYMERMLTGNALSVGSSARSLAEQILHPRPWVLKPAQPLFAFITTGLLPEQLRQHYGLTWSEKKENRLRLLAKVVRCLLPLVPKPLRIVPNARAAEKNRRLAVKPHKVFF